MGKPMHIPAAVARLADPRLYGAACSGMAPAFDVEPLDGEEQQERAERLAVAVKVCTGCPVRAACGTVAEELGRYAAGLVWSGTARGVRGRPRKDMR
ncbi:hypothetical protein [Nocardia sp. NPDC057227]|uniref:hypothetical protein n=1 Tax=Nocardia sp. NPDC057227 TaxID=3346056 RepID=UPI003637D25C